MVMQVSYLGAQTYLLFLFSKSTHTSEVGVYIQFMINRSSSLASANLTLCATQRIPEAVANENINLKGDNFHFANQLIKRRNRNRKSFYGEIKWDHWIVGAINYSSASLNCNQIERTNMLQRLRGTQLNSGCFKQTQLSSNEPFTIITTICQQ